MTTEESSPPQTPRGRPAAYEKGQGSCKICFAENRKEPCAAGYKGISKLGGGESPKLATRKAASITAKEAIVSTMGVLANVAGDTEDAANVAPAIAAWFPSAIAAFSFLMFNLLDSPCLAAIATMAQQLQSRKWFWFAIIFQNVFAYVLSLIVYQLGSFFAGGGFGLGTAAGFALLAVLLYLLFRPDPYRDLKYVSKRSLEAAS